MSNLQNLAFAAPEQHSRRSAGTGLGLFLGLFLGACGGGGGGGGSVAPAATAPLMLVTPDASFQGLGVQGGFASPGTMDYLVKNTGDAPMSWMAESTEDWCMVSPTSGILAPQEEIMVGMVLDQTIVQGLSVGLLTGSIDFTNLDNDAGSVSRGINLNIDPAAPLALLVEPDEDYEAFGLTGGPFAPLSKVYTLSNEGGKSLTWSVRASAEAIQFDVAGGTLLPGAEQDLTISFDQSLAALLPIGEHSLSFGLFLASNSIPELVRSVTLHVMPPKAGSTSASLTQFGITWTFDKPYEVGQFANSDWWVKGPVTVIGISPSSDSKVERRSNGSMINPSSKMGTSQGYDSATYAQYGSSSTYRDRLNVALDVDASSPLLLPAGSSLVSSASLPMAGLRPQTHSSAILTVLAQSAPSGSFRPSYAALDKSIPFNLKQLNYRQLGNLAKPLVTPDLSKVEGWFRRPWIDHIPLWVGRYVHPSENMPDYGREIADQIGTATLMLNLDFTDVEKRTLLVRVVQLGIDLYGIYERDGKATWRPYGGHMSGRKWPIIFAGLVLGDPAMSSVGLDPESNFAEDGQTFYVTETSSGIYNYGEGGYTAADVGLAEWGSYHSTRPSYDNRAWFGDPYRLCCTANVWWGELLSAYIMGARDLWNHDALFDYQDRYMSENLARGIQDFRMGWSRFPLAMWKAYRSNY